MSGLDGPGEPSAARRDWDQGYGRSRRARVGWRRSRGSQKAGRAARGLRLDCRRHCRRGHETWCHRIRGDIQSYCPGCWNREEAAKAGTLDWRGQPEGLLERWRLAGRGLPMEPRWDFLFRCRLRNRTPQRRVNASTSVWFSAPRRLACSSFLRSCWKFGLRRRYSQAKPGASSDRSSS
jgi:hypothetical protein